MNLYVLVEGDSTEKRIYRSWLSFLLPNHSEVESVSAIQQNNLFLLAGHGYPSYLKRIENAIADIQQHGGIDHFLICVDSEEETREAKTAEIQSVLDKLHYFRNTHIIVADCCIETWLLGHQTMVKTNPQSEDLLRFKRHYDVRTDDPELMPGLPEYNTRAQHHFEYLRAVFREQNLTYSKTRPGCWLDADYYNALKARWTTTRHLSSFGAFAILMDEMRASVQP